MILKESNAGFGALSYLPPEIRRKIYDQCTEHIDPYNNASNNSDDPIEIHVSLHLEHGAGIFDFRVHNVNCGNNVVYLGVYASNIRPRV